MRENLVLNNIVSELLANFNKDTITKVAYNYSYPLTFDFIANTNGTALSKKITISGSQLFIFQDMAFNSNGDFDIMLKDVATGRELSEDFINSQLLSYVNFTGYQYKGIYELPMPKVMSGASELYVTVINKTDSVNTVMLNFSGVSINDK